MKKNNKLESLDWFDIFRTLDINKHYYHCCRCGGFYKDKELNIQIASFLQLHGSVHIPKRLQNYDISSGICGPCYTVIKKAKEN